MPDYDFKQVKTLKYERPDIVNGYSDQTLYLNLSDHEMAINPVTEKTKKTFTGGKGYNLWLLWNAVKPTTQWNDPENALCIAAGPLGGTPIYPGSGKSIVATLSPTTASVTWSPAWSSACYGRCSARAGVSGMRCWWGWPEQCAWHCFLVPQRLT